MNTHLESILLEPLGMLASAISGWPMQLRFSNAGQQSYVESSVIYLDPRLNRDWVSRVIVAHSLLFAAGSIDRRILLNLVGRPDITRRYFTLELSRAVTDFADILPEFFISFFSRFSLEKLTCNCDRSLALARDAQVRLPSLPPQLGVIKPLRVLKSSLITKGRALSSEERLDELKAVDFEEANDDSELDERSNRILKLFSNPLFSGGTVFNYLLKVMGYSRTPGNDGGDGDGGAANYVSATILSFKSSIAKSKTKLPLKNLEEVAPPTSICYPEWYESKSAYKENWVHVTETEVEIEVDTPIARREKIDVDRARLRRVLARVGNELQMVKYQSSGEDLDLDQLVDYAVDLKSGQPPKENIYRAPLRTKRDLSVLMLIDASQSTSDRLSSGGSIFGQHKEIAREMASVFNAANSRISIYAFHSWGRHLLRFLKIKSFDEAFGMKAQQRLDLIQPAGLTRLGAAIRHGAHLLEGDKYQKNRLMICFSDGLAYDDQYQDRHAEADTLRALESAAAKGIACICISVGTQKDDEALRRIYGATSYIRCASADELLKKLNDAIGAAMASAAKGGRARLVS